jgi:transcriptional regulator with XRE-family HTH domain
MSTKIDNPELKEYKSKMKRLRVARGMTQTELSTLSEVNVKSIAYYEQYPEKINKASVETLLKICDSLGCGITDIIEKEKSLG